MSFTIKLQAFLTGKSHVFIVRVYYLRLAARCARSKFPQFEIRISNKKVQDSKLVTPRVAVAHAQERHAHLEPGGRVTWNC